jgi:uncharacterized membrane protein
MVHFPIALLLANALFTWLFLRGAGRAFETSAYHCLVVGWVGALLAALTGAWDAWQHVYGPDTPRDTALLNWVNAHAVVGLAIVFVYGRALLIQRRQPDILRDPGQRGRYIWLLVVGVLLVLLDGWIGGRLVYSFGLGTTT